MPPTVRPLIATDFPQALPMLLDMRFVDSETALEQRFPAFCTHPDWALLGAFEGETLLGYAAAQDYGPHIRSGNSHLTAKLHDLYTAPEHRRKGVGRALMQSMEAWGKARGLRYLFWYGQPARSHARICGHGVHGGRRGTGRIQVLRDRLRRGEYPDFRPGAPLLNVHLTARSDVSQKLRRLLQRAHPQFADLWAGVSYWGSEPEYHLWLAQEGRPVAQLGFGWRVVGVNGQEVQIAGIGAVCTDPDWQGRGVGKWLLHELHGVLLHDLPTDFGFLQCREVVTGFYELGGFMRVPQPVRFFDPDEQQWMLNAGPTMVLPVLKGSETWPGGGEVDLRGLPW